MQALQRTIDSLFDLDQDLLKSVKTFGPYDSLILSISMIKIRILVAICIKSYGKNLVCLGPKKVVNAILKMRFQCLGFSPKKNTQFCNVQTTGPSQTDSYLSFGTYAIEIVQLVRPQ